MRIKLAAVELTRVTFFSSGDGKGERQQARVWAVLRPETARRGLGGVEAAPAGLYLGAVEQVGLGVCWVADGRSAAWPFSASG